MRRCMSYNLKDKHVYKTAYNLAQSISSCKEQVEKTKRKHELPRQRPPSHRFRPSSACQCATKESTLTFGISFRAVEKELAVSLGCPGFH